LLKEDGSIAGTLEIVTWYPPMQRRPVAAWVVSWVDTSGEEPVMHRAPVEIPAHGAAGPARRATLLQAAADARQRGPAPIAARAPALPNRPDARQRVRQAELLIDAWDRAFGQLTAAAADDGSSGTYLRYLALTELLARTYTVDRTLQGMWDDVPADLQELASQHADDEALAAIAHNTRVVASSGRLYDPGRERGFDAFFERQRNGAPYPHWTGPLLTGVLQEPFFRGLRWIRGHMTYRGVTDPIELWQYTDGAEPRWKWKDSAAVTSERGNPRERKLYDELLAGQDVLGYFSHLIEVFTEARWFLRALLLRAENRRPYT
jgi:hypothetical protein